MKQVSSVQIIIFSNNTIANDIKCNYEKLDGSMKNNIVLNWWELKMYFFFLHYGCKQQQTLSDIDHLDLVDLCL